VAAGHCLYRLLLKGGVSPRAAAEARGTRPQSPHRAVLHMAQGLRRTAAAPSRTLRAFLNGTRGRHEPPPAAATQTTPAGGPNALILTGRR
jgi:hypothetical protein